MNRDSGNQASAAEAAARTEAVAARRAAEEARRQATMARAEAAEAAQAAEAGCGPSDDERDEELLRDYAPRQGENPFGRPGRPLPRQSPFYLGFFGALGVVLALGLASVVAAARSVLVLVVISLVIAIGLNPIVERLIVRGARRSTAVVVVSLCAVVLLALFAIAIIPVLTEQVTRIIESAPGWLDQLSHNRTLDRLDQRYGVIDRLREQLDSGAVAASAFGGLLGVGKIVLSAVFSFLTVFVLTLYFLASLPQIKRAGYRLAPASRRHRVALLGDEIIARVGGYLGGAFIVVTIAGLAALAFCWLVGLREYAVALAVVVAILDFIPLIGATIGAAIVTIIGFATSPGIGIACIIFFVLYQQLENYFIYPRVMGSTVDVPGAAVVVAALIGGALLGVVGALIAIPAMAALMLIIREVLVPRQDAI